MAVPYRFRSSVLDVVGAGISLDSVSKSDLKPRDLLAGTIMKYDEKAKRVVSVSANEIKDYQTFGPGKNTIVYHMQYETLLNVFVVD